ncbi:hypothetical protein BDR06DRAFT_970293 [Suillus hirtellus]|nr:hypothetical protein BDR06DRAFT_970293 [Suillus hirtellus]
MCQTATLSIRNPILYQLSPSQYHQTNKDLGETVFSQRLVLKYDKLRTAVDVNPLLLLVIVAVINETHRYHTLCTDSPAWNTLLYEPTMCLQDNFIAGASIEPPALHQPVMIEGHMWLSVVMVQFKIWVRPGDIQVNDHTIDINMNDPNVLLITILMELGGWLMALSLTNLVWRRQWRPPELYYF